MKPNYTRFNTSILLTKREKETLQLIAAEYTTKEIAQELFLSQATIETYRRNLFLKMDVRNAAGLIRKSFEQGFLKIEKLAI